jgi:hypothetical protein
MDAFWIPSDVAALARDLAHTPKALGLLAVVIRS